MTKLDTSQCQHHILSAKSSPAKLSTNILCFCSYFHLVLLLKQNLVPLFVFSSSSSWAISVHVCDCLEKPSFPVEGRGGGGGGGVSKKLFKKTLVLAML